MPIWTTSVESIGLPATAWQAGNRRFASSKYSDSSSRLHKTLTVGRYCYRIAEGSLGGSRSGVSIGGSSSGKTWRDCRPAESGMKVVRYLPPKASGSRPAGCTGNSETRSHKISQTRRSARSRSRDSTQSTAESDAEPDTVRQTRPLSMSRGLDGGYRINRTREPKALAAGALTRRQPTANNTVGGFTTARDRLVATKSPGGTREGSSIILNVH